MKTILCLAGLSGCGKTTASEYLQSKYNFNFIESYTDRPPRFDGEKGHTFVTSEEFDNFKTEDMIAYTKFGNYRYCCLHKDVLEGVNVYVIDEAGVEYLKSKFSDMYNIVTIWIDRSLSNRIKFVDEERIARDEGMFDVSKRYILYDYFIANNSEPNIMYQQLDNIMSDIL